MIKNSQRYFDVPKNSRKTCDGASSWTVRVFKIQYRVLYLVSVDYSLLVLLTTA